MLKSLIFALSAMLVTALPAGAHGAVAIGGNPADIAKNGIAVGVSKDDDTKDLAEAGAVEQCKAFKGRNPAQTAARCVVVADFAHAWAVIAMDPKPQSPGFGWSIDADKATAERNAINQCKSSSPDERKQFCALTGELQDTKP